MTVRNEKFVAGIIASAFMHSLLFIGFIFSKNSVPMPAQIFSVDIRNVEASAAD